MEMYNPPHPGEVLKSTYLPGYNLSVSAFALRLGISRNTASEILNGRTRITAPMALKLEKAFKVSAKMWLAIQMQYDLWQAKQTTNLDNVQVIAG